MKFADIFERRKLRTHPGESPRFKAALRSREGGSLTSTVRETQEAADAALLERIRQRFLGSYEPRCIQWRGHTIVIWRDGSLWKYGHINEEGEPTGVTSSGDWQTRDDVERYVRSFLAARQWNGEEETSGVILDGTDQAKFTIWAKREKMLRRFQQTMQEVGWDEKEIGYMLSDRFDCLDPMRVEMLGDPKPMYAQLEKERLAIH
jgi:hypothetical protein